MSSTGMFSKPWSELEFSDNYLFCKIMQNDELCRELLEILLHLKINKLIRNQEEKNIEPSYESRGIRLDVYVEDKTRNFDIEIQTCNYTNLPLRTRYYQGAMDVSKIKHRDNFDALKETYILFICKGDPFKENLPVYTIQNVVKENPAVCYNDKTNRVFYNASAYQVTNDEELKGFLEFIHTKRATTSFSKKLESNVAKAKQKTDWESEYMFFQNVLEECKYQARREGHEEGLAEGRSEGRSEGRAEGLVEGHSKGHAEGKFETLKMIVSNMRRKNQTIETIMEFTGLSELEINQLSL